MVSKIVNSDGTLEKTLSFDSKYSSTYKESNYSKLLKSIASSKDFKHVKLQNENDFEPDLLICENPNDPKKLTLQAEKILENGKAMLLLVGELESVMNLNTFTKSLGFEFSDHILIKSTHLSQVEHPKLTLVKFKKISVKVPFCHKLKVKPPSQVYLSSDVDTFPSNQPIAAVYTDPKTFGKIIALGTSRIFHNDFIEEQENLEFFWELVRELLSGEYFSNSTWNGLDEIRHCPDFSTISSTLLGGLGDFEEFPTTEKNYNVSELICNDLFSIDSDYLLDVKSCYDDIGLKQENLSLIVPKFEIPLPSVKLSHFNPIFDCGNLDGPELEIFDLDQSFNSMEKMLEKLKRGYSEKNDLEGFILEAGKMFNIERENPKEILEVVTRRLIESKLTHLCDPYM